MGTEHNRGLSGEKTMTVKDKFLEILGIANFPETVADLPEEFRLPHEITAELERLWFMTEESGREYSCMIFWDENQNRFNISKIYRGTPNHTSGLYGIAVANSTSRRSKSVPFIEYHSHPIEPLEGRISLFSSRDLALHMVSPKPSFINIVGSERGIIALVGTEESQKISVSESLSQRMHEKRLNRFGFSDGEDFLNNGGIQVLESAGLALYMWKSSIYGIKRGDFEKGLILSRVQPRPLPRLL